MNLQAEVLGLSVAYALLGILVLLGVARSGWPWAFKAGVIVLTSAFYVLVFFRTQGLLGWSAATALPARFEVLWVRTVEPNPASNDPGAIHLWLEALDASNLPSGEPRAYRLPYSTRFARKAEAARVEIQAGHPQGGRAFDFGTGEGEMPNEPAVAARTGAEPGGDPSGAGALDPAFLRGDSQSVLFAPLPAPVLPAKEPQ
jgi:hypothetical protein